MEVTAYLSRLVYKELTVFVCGLKLKFRAWDMNYIFNKLETFAAVRVTRRRFDSQDVLGTVSCLPALNPRS